MGRRSLNTQTCAIGDADNPATQQVGVNPAGQLQVTTEGQRATYSQLCGITHYAASGDFLTLSGSATKIIRLRRVTLHGLATASSIVQINGLRRTGGAYSGAGSSTQVGNPHDTGNPV